MGKSMLLKTGGGIGSEDVTSTKDKVLTGYTAVTKDSNDDPIAGTMPNNGSISGSLNCGQSKSIPAGYTTGGTVTANSLASQTSANAAASQILSGQSAWVNGSKITGTMPNRGTVNQGLSINGSYTIPSGYHSGSGKVTQSIPVQGGSTTTPSTSNKTIVAANRYVNGNIIVAGNSNLTAANIKKGVNIFGVTGTWEGYVATPTDLYKYGANPYGFKAFTYHGEAAMESNQIKLRAQGYSEDDDDGGTSRYWSYSSAPSAKSINLTGYSKLTMTYYVYWGSYYDGNGARGWVKMGTTNSYITDPALTFEHVAQVADMSSSTSIGQKTLTLDVSSINATKYITAQVTGFRGYGFGIYIYQISLS